MQVPPRFDAHPAIQLYRWIRDPFALLADGQARFGDAFTLRLPGRIGDVVIVSDPEMVKQVFALGGDDAHAGKANVVVKPFLGVHSLLLLDGSEHTRQRKMMLPAFHGERMHAYGATMLDLAHASIDAWPQGAPFAVHREMQSITLRIIVRTVFGIEAGNRFADFERLLSASLDVASMPLLLFPAMQRDLGRFSPWGKFRRASEKASRVIREEIGRARRHEGGGDADRRSDILAMLVDSRDESGRRLDDDEVHDQLVTLLVAGHETTATALAWTLRWLLEDKALMARLRAEIEVAGADPERIATLPLLDATVKESLRLQPVLPMVGRVLQRPARIGPYDFRPGSVVAASIYLVHRRASLYPDPQRFHPDRFLSFKPASWEWLPFGGGLRRCIGAAFALYEMKMVLAAVLSRIDAELAVRSVRAVRRSITLTPSGGLPIRVTSRSPRKSHLDMAS
ncbi:MAG TPA: cytochrome P450 [Polyangiaceae bacterium]|jgi:cytochrome P450|nr:cytochrome P450 [Polyangiaceae bacterium]